jgi:O-antigen/teichoic acid export membrane protein
MTEFGDTLESRESGDKIIRGGSLRIGSYVVGILVGLLSAPLLVRHLGVSDYGLYVTANSIVFVVAGLTEGGLASVAVREYATSGKDERRALLDSLLGLRFVLTLIGYLGAIAFAIIAGYPTVLVGGVIIAGAGMVIGAQQNTLALILQSELKLGTLAAIDMARQIGTTALIALLVIAGASLLPFYAVAPAGLVIALAVTMYYVRDAKLRPRFNSQRWGGLLRQTGVYAIATALAVLYFQVAIISTSLLSNEHQAGLYGAAFRIVEIANGIPWLLAAAAFPLVAHAAHNDSERMRYAQSRIFDTNLIAGAFFAVVIAVGAPFAMRFIGGSKLDGAVPVLRTLAIGVPFTFMIATWAYALLSMRLHRPLLIANAAAVALALALSFILIPKYGARGSGWVTAALEVSLAIGYLICVVRADRELRPPLMGIVKVVPSAAIALAAGFLVPLSTVPATIVAATVYLGLILLTRAIPEEIAAAMKARWPYPRAR